MNNILFFESINPTTISKKYNIQGDIRTLLGENCEVEKVMRFLKETNEE